MTLQNVNQYLLLENVNQYLLLENVNQYLLLKLQQTTNPLIFKTQNINQFKDPHFFNRYAVVAMLF